MAVSRSSLPYNDIGRQYLSDYYAALLRTHTAFVAPTQGALLNYVQRVPLGVVAQITVCSAVVESGGRLKQELPSPLTTPSLSLSRKSPPHWRPETP